MEEDERVYVTLRKIDKIADEVRRLLEIDATLTLDEIYDYLKNVSDCSDERF